MMINKNYLVLGGLILALWACGNAHLTTFKVLYPANETRRVDLETLAGRESLRFEEGDTMREALLQLPLKKGEYAHLWVGDMPYTVWMDAGNPWLAKFKWNEWFFEGNDADINNYLNKRFFNQIFFTDYYRIPNEEFRTKLQNVSIEREKALQEADLDPVFTARERKRLQYIRNRHLASGVAYGEVKDGRMNLAEDTRSELHKAMVEDSTSWGIFEYRESIDKALVALAKIDGLQKAGHEIVLDVLQMATSTYKDQRLVEYLVYKNVMEYIKAAGTENIGKLDSIFRKQVQTPERMAAYDEIYKANIKLTKGQPAVSFTFKDMKGEDVSLSDFKGKYVYIDLWATWCGPCVAEIPFLKKLEEHFRGKNICFVSISSDKDRKVWEKYVREREMEGVQLHMGDDKEYMKEIRCAGIPRFLLIDQEGNFIDANMTRPSDPKTLETLEKLEGLR